MYVECSKCCAAHDITGMNTGDTIFCTECGTTLILQHSVGEYILYPKDEAPNDD